MHSRLETGQSVVDRHHRTVGTGSTDNCESVAPFTRGVLDQRHPLASRHQVTIARSVSDHEALNALLSLLVDHAVECNNVNLALPCVRSLDSRNKPCILNCLDHLRVLLVVCFGPRAHGNFQLFAKTEDRGSLWSPGGNFGQIV